MSKRSLGVITTSVLAVSMLAGCASGSKPEATNAGSTEKAAATASPAGTKPVTLSILQYAPEMTDAMHHLADEYHKQNPNVTIDITIHQDDYPTLLKTRINSGDIPDIFMSGAYNENKTYKDYAYDLSKEDFMKNIADSAKTGVTLDGKVLGYPFILQSHSFIYNKKLFAEAGITELPKTYSQLEEAAKKLQAKGIIPFSNGYKEWWVLEQTFTQVMSSMGGDYAATFAEINAGKKKLSDIPAAMNIFDLLDITTKYGNPKPLETDFNAQVNLFAQGKAAIMHQGTWAEESIRKINKDLDIGFMAGPVGEDGSKAGLMVDSNIVYRINKDSKNLKEVLKFFNWLTTSDYGKKFVPAETKQISTIKDAPFPDAQLAKATSEFVKSGVTYPWVKGYWPDGYEQKAGEILQKYVGGAATRDQIKDELDKTWAKLAKAAE
ncbi:ABC transporter substrate-binding protein [Paenibacillus sp. GCM10027628]|uniref:ABC transporter substrate-binding protein n=1 Tax=Paenibacillus sp. GCM10027628 TaxID=3273413 RepID=UPI003639788A